MSNKESHPIRNSAIASIISGVILSFWAPFREFLLKTALWFWGLLNSGCEWLSSSHEVYGWALIFLVGFSIPALLKLAFLIVKKNEPGAEDLYISDRLFGANWHWRYINGSIQNLWCLCPSCKNELVYFEIMPSRYDFTHDGLEAKTDFICERCNTTKCSLKGNKQYALGTVEREIRRKIRSKEWQNIKSS